MNAERRLIVVSNRLPLIASEDSPRFQPSSGGLISALVPVIDDSWSCWIGWAGTHDEPKLAELLRERFPAQRCSFAPVFLTAAESASFYRGFSNETIWPLFHGFSSRCQFEAGY